MRRAMLLRLSAGLLAALVLVFVADSHLSAVTCSTQCSPTCTAYCDAGDNCECSAWEWGWWTCGFGGGGCSVDCGYGQGFTRCCNEICPGEA